MTSLPFASFLFFAAPSSSSPTSTSPSSGAPLLRVVALLLIGCCVVLAGASSSATMSSGDSSRTFGLAGASVSVGRDSGRMYVSVESASLTVSPVYLTACPAGAICVRVCLVRYSQGGQVELHRSVLRVLVPHSDDLPASHVHALQRLLEVVVKVRVRQ